MQFFLMLIAMIVIISTATVAKNIYRDDDKKAAATETSPVPAEATTVIERDVNTNKLSARDKNSFLDDESPSIYNDNDTDYVSVRANTTYEE